jgi:hypothetical protein
MSVTVRQSDARHGMREHEAHISQISDMDSYLVSSSSCATAARSCCICWLMLSIFLAWDSSSCGYCAVC